VSEQGPQKLGKYEIIEEIGRGGFSVVYKALDTSLHNRPVALKVLHPHLLVDPTFVLRLQQEAGAAANLRHPNIVVVYEVGEIDGTYYIAIEYLPGTALDDLVKEQGSFPPKRAVRITKQIASALDYAHAEGFIHRDVKSGNIIVGEDDHATLTDFGLVRAAEGTSLTSTGKVVGTPEYMSPEQADPMKTRDLDWRTDLYSLGIVAYELLTGHVPFKGDTPTATHYMHVHEEPPKPTLMNPDLPKEMEPPILKALAKERSDRYQTGQDLAEALAEETSVPKAIIGWKWLLMGGFGALLVLVLIVCSAVMLARLGQVMILPPPTQTTAPVMEPTSTPTATRVASPTPTALPTNTPTQPPTSTPLPTATPTLTPSPTPCPTSKPLAAPQPITPPPSATPTVTPTTVPECRADVACLRVHNYCGGDLVMTLARTVPPGGYSAETPIDANSEKTIQLPAGEYAYTASTLVESPKSDRCDRARLGTITVAVGNTYDLGFTVVCGELVTARWRTYCTWDLVLVE